MLLVISICLSYAGVRGKCGKETKSENPELWEQKVCNG